MVTIIFVIWNSSKWLYNEEQFDVFEYFIKNNRNAMIFLNNYVDNYPDRQQPNKRQSKKGQYFNYKYMQYSTSHFLYSYFILSTQNMEKKNYIKQNA